MKGDVVIGRWSHIDGKAHALGRVLDKGRDEYFQVDMLGRLVFFYLWAAETLPDDGSLAGIDNKTIAKVSTFHTQKDEEADEFVDALLDVGVLEEDEGGLRVHAFDRLCPRD